MRRADTKRLLLWAILAFLAAVAAVVAVPGERVDDYTRGYHAGFDACQGMFAPYVDQLEDSLFKLTPGHIVLPQDTATRSL